MSVFSALALAAATSGALGLSGTWELRSGEAIIFRLNIKGTPSDQTVIWERPEKFETDGELFSELDGPIVRRQAQRIQSADGDLDVTFEGSKGKDEPDVIRVHAVDAMRLRVTYNNTEPFYLTRSASFHKNDVIWARSIGNEIRIIRPTNSEMASIYDADQSDRAADVIDWTKLASSDADRRARTRKLLESGDLQSADDYFHAAFVLQHGEKPEDFLEAHLLAMVSVAKGKTLALWIASATLDRYLQNIGRPQVLGTQYRFPGRDKVTQEPYDKELIPDTVRRVLHVRSIYEQELKRMEILAGRQ